MSASACALCEQDLKEGLFVYRNSQPEVPGVVVCWNCGAGPAATEVTVKWLDRPPTMIRLPELHDFASFVAELRKDSEKYARLLEGVEKLGEEDAKLALPGERRDCLTCRHRTLPISETPCVSCGPVTRGAVNWVRRREGQKPETEKR